MGGLWSSPVSPYHPKKRKKGIFTSRMRDKKCQYQTSLHIGSGGATGNTNVYNYTLILNNYASLRFRNGEKPSSARDGTQPRQIRATNMPKMSF